MIKLNKIKIGNTEYPILCDLNVLEFLQEKFETLQNFERKLLGLELEYDEFGLKIYDDEGNAKMKLVEPSIKAICTALPEMINEGLAIEAERSGKEYKEVNPLLLMAECDTDYRELASIIHEEFSKRFESKKSKPTVSRMRKKNQ